MVELRLEGYDGLELIGEGGLGQVFRARRKSTGGFVAIKQLVSVSQGSSSWQRAQRELEALLRLKGHPHVIYVEEIIDCDGIPCLVMELATQGSLHDRVAGGPLPLPELALVGEQVCDALIASHTVGVLHRDIKPQNLLVNGFGQVKVADFGIASLARDGDVRTKTSHITLAYASPEELEGGEIGPGTDVYSFAATMAHLSSGRRPTMRELALGAPDFRVSDARFANVKDLLRRSLDPDPLRRPSTARLLDGFGELASRLGSGRLRSLPIFFSDPTSRESQPPSTDLSVHEQREPTGGSAQTEAAGSRPATLEAEPPARKARKRLYLLVGAGLVGALVLAVVAASTADRRRSTSVGARVSDSEMTVPQTGASLSIDSPPLSGLPEESLDVPLVIGLESAWIDGEAIPMRYACNGANVSPPLEWAPAPEGTVEIAVTIEDLDQPTFVYWVMSGIDPFATSLAEGVVPEFAIVGVNGLGSPGYAGPCPPVGETHTYIYTVHFLNQATELSDGVAGADLQAFIRGATLESHSIAGTYP